MADSSVLAELIQRVQESRDEAAVQMATVFLAIQQQEVTLLQNTVRALRRGDEPYRIAALLEGAATAMQRSTDSMREILNAPAG